MPFISLPHYLNKNQSQELDSQFTWGQFRLSLIPVKLFKEVAKSNSTLKILKYNYSKESVCRRNRKLHGDTELSGACVCVPLNAPGPTRAWARQLQFARPLSRETCRVQRKPFSEALTNSRTCFDDRASMIQLYISSKQHPTRWARVWQSPPWNRMQQPVRGRGISRGQRAMVVNTVKSTALLTTIRKNFTEKVRKTLTQRISIYLKWKSLN